jgi:hypothetical protein
VVCRLSNSGGILKYISVGAHPTGVAVDANGKVWVTNLEGNSAQRIDPAGGGDGLGQVDMTVNLGAGAGPYNYSDMTGAVAMGVTSLQGTWNVVRNSGTAGTEWGKVSWTEDLPTGTDIKIEVRAASSEAGLASGTFVEVTNGVSFCENPLTGQYIEIRATLLREENISASPVLYDLTLELCDNTPPELTCPANIEQNTDVGACEAVVTWEVTASDNCSTPEVVCTPPSGSTFDKGTTTVYCVATDEKGNESTCSFTVTVKDNEAPAISCPANIEVNTEEGVCTAVVTWDITATDNCGIAELVCDPPSGSTFDKGTTIVNCIATDVSGISTECSFTVTVNDNEYPTITLSVSPTELWPPNHSLVTITADVVTSDNCEGYTYVLESITSSEADNGLGDGDTENDIQNAEFGTSDLSFDVRAERAGNGVGRTYTITYKVIDASGNETFATAYVFVPKSKGKAKEMPYDDEMDGIAVQLKQNQPNPFSELTEIQYFISQPDFAVLVLTDINGREVAKLVSKFVSAGWNKLNFNGSNLPNGTYLLILESNGKVAVRTIQKNN